MASDCRIPILKSLLVTGLLLSFAAIVYAQSSEILGEIELVGVTDVEKTSGVPMDGHPRHERSEVSGGRFQCLEKDILKHLAFSGNRDGAALVVDSIIVGSPANVADLRPGIGSFART